MAPHLLPMYPPRVVERGRREGSANLWDVWKSVAPLPRLLTKPMIVFHPANGKRPPYGAFVAF